MKPGDELVSVNGLSFKEVPMHSWYVTINIDIVQNQYAEKNKYVFGGATKDAAIRAALFSLTVIPGRSHRLPEEDDITFGFKSSRDGEEYSVTTPVRFTACHS